MAITATDKSALETASPADQGEDQLAPLVSLIKLGLGKFTLATVRYQQPGQRQQIVASLRKALPGKTLVEISLQDSSLDLLSAPLQLFQSLKKLAYEHTKGKPFDAVLLVDWEKRLIQQNPPEQQPSTSLTGQFNIGRDILKSQFSCPFIMLLPDWSAHIVKQLAPDLMSWRSGDFAVTDIERAPSPAADVAQKFDRDIETKAWWDVFRGAAALTSDDPIFGREEDLEKTLKMVLDPTFRCGTIWGETGCGKTSFVRAGLEPELGKAKHEPIYLSEYTDPVTVLKKALAEIDPDLKKPETTLKETVKALKLGKGKLIFLLLDQFERAYTEDILNRQDLKAFLKDLAACINDLSLPIRCIFLVRADRLYHLCSDFDELTPLNHPLAPGKRYELLLLRQGDAERVLTQLGERIGAAWPNELIAAVIGDLSRDDRVKPVEIQLIATGLYLSSIATTNDYERAGRRDGLLRNYLNAIFSIVSKPILARRVVRELVLASDPPARALLTTENITAALGRSTEKVVSTLEELGKYGLVSTRSEDRPSTKSAAHFELVHDVLIEPALRATTSQEIGLHVIHTALLANRKWLGPRGYWLARKADLIEFSNSEQRSEAHRLLRRSLLALYGSALVALCIIVAAIQFSFIHVDINDDTRGTQPIMFHRGLPMLTFLPGPFGPSPLVDTGISFRHDAPRYNRSQIERAWVFNWIGVELKAGLLLPHLHPIETGKWYCYLGHWEKGLEILASEQTRLILEFVSSNPKITIPVLAKLLGDVEIDAKARRTAAWALGIITVPEAQAPAVVDKLVAALADQNDWVRSTAAEALGKVSIYEWNLDLLRSLVKAMQGKVTHEDSTVRTTAAKWLGKAKLAIAIQNSPENSNVFDSPLGDLTNQRESRLDAGYRRGLVYALAYWYNAGRDDAGEENEFKANPRAKQEHDALQSRLAELRDTGPLWQRAAIAQVWVTAYQLRHPKS